MPRRRTAHKPRGTAPEDHRPAGLGTHFRADGTPKTSYPTQHDALAASEERRRESGVDLNVYRCDLCSAWHMGAARPGRP